MRSPDKIWLKYKNNCDACSKRDFYLTQAKCKYIKLIGSPNNMQTKQTKQCLLYIDYIYMLNANLPQFHGSICNLAIPKQVKWLSCVHCCAIRYMRHIDTTPLTCSVSVAVDRGSRVYTCSRRTEFYSTVSVGSLCLVSSIK